MPSITPMISAIFFDEDSMRPIERTTSPTIAPPRVATSEADAASWLAWRAFDAFCCTVQVSCSVVAAVSSSAPACCSVRLLRSTLPEAISVAASVILREPADTLSTTRVKAAFMSLSAPSRRPVSSRLATTMLAVRSPRDTFCASSTACAIERVMPRVIRTPSSRLARQPARAKPTSVVLVEAATISVLRAAAASVARICRKRSSRGTKTASHARTSARRRLPSALVILTPSSARFFSMRAWPARMLAASDASWAGSSMISRLRMLRALSLSLSRTSCTSSVFG
jgi:hypothetical protein